MRLLLAALLIAFTLPALPFAPPTPSDDDVNRVARQLYCPVCENTPLDVCPTLACADWRALIRQKLAEGWSDQQIFDYFVDTYGDRVLVQPPQRGFNWLIYVVPPIVLLGGALLAWRVVGGLVRPQPARAATTPPEPAAPETAPQDAYVARLEREVASEGQDEG
jgi:cytochrome c-type biogenesis protein CcmH